MNSERIDTFLCSLPFTHRSISKQGKLRYWLGVRSEGGHMFALMELEPQKTRTGERPLLLSFSAGDDYAALLEEPDFVPAPYLARSKWVAIPIATSLPFVRWAALLKASYNITLAKLNKTLQQKIKAL